MKKDLNDQIDFIEKKLQFLLGSNEYDYAQGFNIYATHKEKELKHLIDEIISRYDDKRLHD